VPTIFLKRESVNTKAKARARQSDADGVNRRTTRQENNSLAFSFRETKCAVSGAAQHRKSRLGVFEQAKYRK
jgi:hypothetical protein